MDTIKAILQLPKTELHCHLDGSIRPATILELALKHGFEVPTKDLNEFKKFVQVGEDCSSLSEYLKKFELPVEIFNNKEDLYRITMELLEDASNEGILYIEPRFGPLINLKGDITPEDKIEAILRAMKDGEKEFGIYGGLILCCMRHENVENSIQVVNLAKKYMHQGVVAVDLAGDEHGFPPELHKAAFDMAKEAGLNITIHAGETGIHENIIKSIEILHAQRIGHGIYAFQDESIIQYLVDNKIPVEMCIKSNIHTRATENYETHPFKKYFERGVKVTLNTDNRTVSNCTLMDEYKKLLEVGFTYEDIVKVVKNGIVASFASEKIKKQLIDLLPQKSYSTRLHFQDEKIPQQESSAQTEVFPHSL